MEGGSQRRSTTLPGCCFNGGPTGEGGSVTAAIPRSNSGVRARKSARLLKPGYPLSSRRGKGLEKAGIHSPRRGREPGNRPDRRKNTPRLRGSVGGVAWPYLGYIGVGTGPRNAVTEVPNRISPSDEVCQ